MKTLITVDQPDHKSATGGIHEALDQLGGTSGMVQLGAAEFLVHQSLRIPNLTTLAGCGPATRVVLASGTGRPPDETHVIVNRDRDAGFAGTTIRDLSVDGNYKEQLWSSRDRGGGGLAFDGANLVVVVVNTWRNRLSNNGLSDLSVADGMINAVSVEDRVSRASGEVNS